MRHLITNIDTSIKDRELYVSFNIETEWYPFAEVPFSSIQKNIGQLSVFEIDLLEGCYLEPSSFYKRGDKLPDGKTVFEENKFPKTWKINIDGTLDELRERNKSKLLSFQTIYSVDISDKNSKEPYIKVTTTDDHVYFTKVPTFKSLVGVNESEFEILKGVFISPIMYKKGDSSEYNGRFITITQDDKIVASFNIRIEGTLVNNYNLHGDARMKNESSYSPALRRVSFALSGGSSKNQSPDWNIAPQASLRVKENEAIINSTMYMQPLNVLLATSLYLRCNPPLSGELALRSLEVLLKTSLPTGT